MFVAENLEKQMVLNYNTFVLEGTIWCWKIPFCLGEIAKILCCITIHVEHSATLQEAARDIIQGTSENEVHVNFPVDESQNSLGFSKTPKTSKLNNTLLAFPTEDVTMSSVLQKNAR